VTFCDAAERPSSFTPGELISVSVTRARLGNASLPGSNNWPEEAFKIAHRTAE